MERHRQYKEILILDHLLSTEGIPHEMKPSCDGYIIGFPDLEKDPDVLVSESMMTYDSRLDLLELVDWTGKQYLSISAEGAMRIIRDAKDRLGIRKWKCGRRSL